MSSSLKGFRRWLLFAALAALLGWFGLVSAPEPDPISARPRDTWNLPPLQRWKASAGPLIMIADAALWGPRVKSEAAAVAAPPEDLRWRIAGVVKVGDSAKVLISFMDPNKPQQLLPVGATLPSGHRISRIEERQVCVAIGKRSYTLPIERLDLAP